MEKLKHILFLSYHYEPDLSAGSFRNTSLSKELSRKLDDNHVIHLICTQPNRYLTVLEKLDSKQTNGNLIVYRVDVPQHGNTFLRQLLSYYYYQREVWKITKDLSLCFVFASTSKLFTGYLAYRISKKRKLPFYLDLRDLFAENLKEFIKLPLINKLISNMMHTFFERPMLMHATHININSEGFRDNIPKEFKGTTSFFPNGIDDEFSSWRQDPKLEQSKPKNICYAGNIGEGQGLHKIIPQLAASLKDSHRFVIIGEGSAKKKLINKVREMNLDNVSILPPVKRRQLLQHYHNAHYLFLHLNDFKSFEKVLPSKLFEYAGGNIPILAGVTGYARKFMQSELKENMFIFDPCDVGAIRDYLKRDIYTLQSREAFVKKFSRQQIADAMTDSIIRHIRATDEET